jgi:AcrR family transcriptional regulator
MPRLTNPQQTILTCAYRLFHRHGFNRVNMDEIAGAARVTKRTLYYHFRSKDDLIAAALEHQHALAVATFRTWTDRISRKPEAIIASLFGELRNWATERNFFGSGFTRVAFELAEMPGHPARAIARRHERMIEDLLADLLVSAGVRSARRRARQIYTLLEGAAAMMLVHGDQSYVSTAAEVGNLILTDRAPVRKRPSRAMRGR